MTGITVVFDFNRFFTVLNGSGRERVRVARQRNRDQEDLNPFERQSEESSQDGANGSRSESRQSQEKAWSPENRDSERGGSQEWYKWAWNQNSEPNNADSANEPRREQSQPSFPVNLGIQYLLEEKILLSIGESGYKSAVYSRPRPKLNITKLSKILGLGGLPNRQGGKLQKLLQFLQTYVQSWTLSMQQLAILLRLCCAMFTLATHHETAERQHLVHHLQLVALQLY